MKYLKSYNESVRDKMTPKSEEDIDDAYEEVANKAADILVDKYDYDDFYDAYEWAIDHKEVIMREIDDDPEYDLNDIIYKILYGWEGAIDEGLRDKMTPKSPEDIKRDLMKLSPEDKISKGTQHNIKDLIEMGVEEGGDMEIALRWACRRGDVDMVRNLLDSGVDPNTYLALSEAVNWGRIDIVKILLEAGANPHANMNYCFIQSATKYGKDSEMSNLLKQYSKNPLIN